MVEAMDDPKVGVCGMKLLFPEDLGDLQSSPVIRPRGKVQHVGIAMNIRTECFHIFLGWDADHPKVNAVRQVSMVTGASLMTRRTLWNRVGGFLDAYGLGTYEDCDYCLSVKKSGLDVIVETKAVGYHYTGASAESNRIAYPMMQNRLLFLQRWQNNLEWDEVHWW
jgi:GT2 family glycosyltransferase